jgi:hypothetical protein
MPALITNKKRPKEKMVIGMVNTVRIGFTTAFRKANTTANIKADL